MIRTLRYALLATALLAGAAHAGARDELKAFTTGLKGLQGQFVQKVYDPRGKLKETSSGTVALSAPRLFRWQYAKPFEQLIVADGRKVWVYDPDLSQVTVRPQGNEERNSPLTALIDPGKLDKMYDVSQDATASNGLEWLTLTPKVGAQATFEVARLGFSGNALTRMEVTDAVGQKTEITFAGLKRNPGFAAGTFSYTPAKGVDVVNGN